MSLGTFFLRSSIWLMECYLLVVGLKAGCTSMLRRESLRWVTICCHYLIMHRHFTCRAPMYPVRARNNF
uniref:Secreted protein n=1 Tax=Rhizophora mucronata TaxID=61149 RepID=A0A2P2KEB8_RHIMU